MSWFLSQFEKISHQMQATVHIPVLKAYGCCQIEVENVTASTYDWSRLGIQREADPREADLLLVAGWISPSLKSELESVYKQLVGKKSVIAIGACAISGAPYQNSGEKLITVSDFLPVDVFVPGCPPRPEAILEAIRILNLKIRPGPDQRAVLSEALRDGH